MGKLGLWGPQLFLIRPFLVSKAYLLQLNFSNVNWVLQKQKQQLAAIFMDESSEPQGLISHWRNTQEKWNNLWGPRLTTTGLHTSSPPISTGCTKKGASFSFQYIHSITDSSTETLSYPNLSKFKLKILGENTFLLWHLQNQGKGWWKMHLYLHSKLVLRQSLWILIPELRINYVIDRIYLIPTALVLQQTSHLVLQYGYSKCSS